MYHSAVDIWSRASNEKKSVVIERYEEKSSNDEILDKRKVVRFLRSCAKPGEKKKKKKERNEGDTPRIIYSNV